MAGTSNQHNNSSNLLNCDANSQHVNLIKQGCKNADCANIQRWRWQAPREESWNRERRQNEEMRIGIHVTKPEKPALTQYVVGVFC